MTDYEHTTLDSARTALEGMIEDATADGHDGDAVVYDLLLSLELGCAPDVRVELWRTELGIKPPVPLFETPQHPPVSDRARAIAEANRERAKDRHKKETR